jgi:hypothetical protein
MRRLATPLLVAALGAVALVAVLDALESPRAVSPPSPPPAAQRVPPPSPPELPPELGRVLTELGVRGSLGWSDAACHRYELALPGLARREFLTRGCDVFSRTGNVGIEDGAVSWFAFSGGSTELLSRDELDAALGGGRHRVRDVAWLGGTRFAALVAQPERHGHVVAIFDGHELDRVVTQVGPTWTEIRASPLGSYFAVLHRAGGVAIYNRLGRPVGPPSSLRQAVAVAWSPDERWSALATKRNVWIVGANQIALNPSVVLPLRAVDLDWRVGPE